MGAFQLRYCEKGNVRGVDIFANFAFTAFRENVHTRKYRIKTKLIVLCGRKLSAARKCPHRE